MQFGYFETPKTNKPTHDPGLDGLCPVCLNPLKSDKITTISFHQQNSNRSWFYRIHMKCTNPDIENNIESMIIDTEPIREVVG